MKRMARKVVNATIAALSPHRWPARDNRLLVLTYHRVLPADFPELNIVEPGMRTSSDTFDMHMKFIRSEFEPIDLAEWLRKLQAGETLPRRACAVTFDDGWVDNYSYAFPILQKHQVPATIFVVSSFVGTNRSFWPERLARALVRRRNAWGTVLPADDRPRSRWLDDLVQASGIHPDRVTAEECSAVIAAAKVNADAVNHRMLDDVDSTEGTSNEPATRDLLSWDQLREMIDSGYVSVGSHTMNHTRLLESLPRETVELEVVGSRDQITRTLDTDVELFCFPNGDVSRVGLDVVRQSFAGACSTREGWNEAARIDCYGIRRMTIHDDRTNTETAFVSRISGWL